MTELLNPDRLDVNPNATKAAILGEANAGRG
jgi:hypothetical protein